MKEFIIGIDQGTSGTFVCIMNSEVRIIERADAEHRQYYPHKGWVEQDPGELWGNACDLLNHVIHDAGINAEEVAGVGIANQGESVVLWDSLTNQPLSRVVVWQDSRTQELIDKELAREISICTGLLPDSYFSASKIKWLLDHTPNIDEIRKSGRLRCGTLDTWLIWKLTEGSAFVTDVSTASRTLLFNIHSLQWDERLFDVFNIPLGIMPEVMDSTANFGEISHPDVNLKSVSILTGIVDQPAAMLGQGCIDAVTKKFTECSI